MKWKYEISPIYPENCGPEILSQLINRFPKGELCRGVQPYDTYGFGIRVDLDTPEHHELIELLHSLGMEQGDRRQVSHSSRTYFSKIDYDLAQEDYDLANYFEVYARDYVVNYDETILHKSKIAIPKRAIPRKAKCFAYGVSYGFCPLVAPPTRIKDLKRSNLKGWCLGEFYERVRDKHKLCDECRLLFCEKMIKVERGKYPDDIPNLIKYRTVYSKDSLEIFKDVDLAYSFKDIDAPFNSGEFFVEPAKDDVIRLEYVVNRKFYEWAQGLKNCKLGFEPILISEEIDDLKERGII